MDNVEIADRLTELGDLLEIQGSNPFRIRAYRNAIRTILGLTRSLSEMVGAGEDLTELPGIGADLSSHIRELVETGELTLLAEVAKEVPRELARLTRLDGVGPKTAARLWKELDVVTVDDLEAAAKAGRVEALAGFGEVSATRILKAIEDFRKHQGRFLRLEAARLLEPLLEHLRATPGLSRIEVAGSFRRGRDTVGDIDLLAVVEAPSAGAGDPAADLMARFASFPSVERVSMAGSTRGSVVLRSGLPVDLRILPPESYGAALHYFTGSMEHNVEIRKRARARGLKVSEYGVFRVGETDGSGSGSGRAGGTASDEEGDRSDGAGVPEAEAGAAPPGERIAGATEEELFLALDLPWIPPVLRENRGEIEAGAAGTLPRLVEAGDIRGDLHMHTTWSDGRESVRTMAEACRDRGYRYMAVTDHSRAVTVARGLTPERIREQWVEIDRVRDEVGGIRILKGCEVDILKDGTLDLPDEILEELDIVLIAVHSHFTLDQAAMTNRILRALAHPLVDVLVHPTGRLLNRRQPYAVDVEAVLQGALEHDVAVELNASPRRLDLHDGHLFRARELGLRVSVATDAHRISQLDYMTPGLEQARRGWLEPERIVNTLPEEELFRWLAR